MAIPSLHTLLVSNCPNRLGLKSRGCTEAGRALLELVAHSFLEYGRSIYFSGKVGVEQGVQGVTEKHEYPTA